MLIPIRACAPCLHNTQYGDHIVRFSAPTQKNACTEGAFKPGQNSTLAGLDCIGVSDLEQQPGWTVPVLLRWRALQAAPEDVTLSVQPLDENGNWLVGSDGDPNSELPPQHWRNGDRLHAIRWLDLPDDLPTGRYQVVALLHYAHDLSRISAIDVNGQPLKNNAWPVANIIVVSP